MWFTAFCGQKWLVVILVFVVLRENSCEKAVPCLLYRIYSNTGQSWPSWNTNYLIKGSMARVM